MSKKKHKTKYGLTSYYRRKMNANDLAQWVEENKEDLMKPDDKGVSALTIQQSPDNPEKEIWFLRFEK